MKKTYPVSSKAKKWAKHLKPEGKRAANKSTRRINKAESSANDETILKVAPPKKRKKFGIEFHNGNGRWKIHKRYLTEGRRNSSLEAVIKKYKNSNFETLTRYEFRAQQK